MVVSTRHRFHIANDVEAFTGDVDDETRVGGLRNLRIILGAGDQQCELRTARTRDEPLVTIDHPFVTVLIRMGSNERGITPCNLWFGHREA